MEAVPAKKRMVWKHPQAIIPNYNEYENRKRRVYTKNIGEANTAPDDVMEYKLKQGNYSVKDQLVSAYLKYASTDLSDPLNRKIWTKNKGESEVVDILDKKKKKKKKKVISTILSGLSSSTDDSTYSL